ncbi:MAG TPA: serine--tRNA ligase, partial [Planctomycetaceae bacterium]|nr:serine--tRNA ligase [Planctomycetaceae bacterium]
MLDLQFICDNVELVAENCRNRGIEVDVDRLVELRRQRSSLIAQSDQLRHDQKQISARISKTSDAEQKQKLIAHGKELRQQIQQLGEELSRVESELRQLQARIPNLTHPDAPVSRDPKGNVVLRTWGELPQFDFEPLDHVALAEKHDLIDFEGGARVAGHGFYYLKNEAVLLELALVQYAVDKVRRKGFTLHVT